MEINDMLDLVKLEAEVNTDHRRRQAAAKTLNDQFDQLVVALEAASKLIVSEFAIFKKYGYHPVAQIKRSGFEAILEVRLLRGDDFEDYAGRFTTTYRPVDTKNVEYRAVLMHPKKTFTQAKLQPKALAASFLAGHKVHLERAFTKFVMA
jgi:hypothetical protein